ncbi:MAG TPA: class I SAM-dependent methyltransferase [Methylophaga aminisulfidivorans]|uniref:Class I SAM-dependent methyltransferase n=1 Tax=Methylophaga aminisulfidivorans TaxID=230105 RepID=A0A7C2A8J2_9GAMM|nr:class I SAM-dependent methyltransferase [Methylophaga sp.]HEC75092.1 class I SAM-dependent methyltransferase [Methylophaga aminisulfidivorans]
MNPDDIGNAYDTITHLWQREGFNRNNGIEAHKRAINFTDNRGNALDVGCGCTGRFIDLLQTEGFSVEGVDISTKMIDLARQRHPEVTFHHQDICEWEIENRYDFITAWDSIWHIPLEQQKPVLTKLVNSLNTGGILIFSFGGTTEPSENIDDFMGPEVYYSSLGTNGFLALLMKLGCLAMHLEYDQYPELHTYLIVKKLTLSDE